MNIISLMLKDNLEKKKVHLSCCCLHSHHFNMVTLEADGDYVASSPVLYFSLLRGLSQAKNSSSNSSAQVVVVMSLSAPQKNVGKNFTLDGKARILK